MERKFLEDLESSIALTTQDIENAIKSRELEQINDDEFFNKIKDMCGRLSDIHRVLKISVGDDDAADNETESYPAPAHQLPATTQQQLPPFPVPAPLPPTLPTPPVGFIHQPTQPAQFPMTPLPFPTLPGPSYPPRPLSQPPMLYEPPPGVVILHETNGRTCGGKPDGKVVLKTTKNTDLQHFSAKLTGIEFVSAKKKLFNFLETICAQENMYTQVAILSRISPSLHHRIDELKQKKEYYTSFTMFFDEFQDLVFPDLDAIIIRELHQHKQGN